MWLPPPSQTDQELFKNPTAPPARAFLSERLLGSQGGLRGHAEHAEQIHFNIWHRRSLFYIMPGEVWHLQPMQVISESKCQPTVGSITLLESLSALELSHQTQDLWRVHCCPYTRPDPNLHFILFHLTPFGFISTCILHISAGEN